MSVHWLARHHGVGEPALLGDAVLRLFSPQTPLPTCLALSVQVTLCLIHHVYSCDHEFRFEAVSVSFSPRSVFLQIVFGSQGPFTPLCGMAHLLRPLLGTIASREGRLPSSLLQTKPSLIQDMIPPPPPPSPAYPACESQSLVLRCPRVSDCSRMDVCPDWGHDIRGISCEFLEKSFLAPLGLSALLGDAAHG